MKSREGRNRNAEDIPEDGEAMAAACISPSGRAGLRLPASRGGVVAPGVKALRGRGARSARSGRHEPHVREAADDGWGILERLATEPLKTEVRDEAARTIISRNDSPDICFERSVNPYRGCEHGCIYCYARPGHAHLGHSPGLDFESRLTAKVNAPELFARELRHPAWRPAPVVIGPNTDAYQPVERRYRITRRLLEVAEEFGQPVGLVTKSALVTRDIDILSRLAKRNLVKVAISITTLDAGLARMMEPRASTPAKRLDAIGALSQAGGPASQPLHPPFPRAAPVRRSAGASRAVRRYDGERKRRGRQEGMRTCGHRPVHNPAPPPCGAAPVRCIVPACLAERKIVAPISAWNGMA